MSATIKFGFSLVEEWIDQVIVLTTVLSFLAIGIMAYFGTSVVISHILYIPIVLFAYRYPKYGIRFGICISLIYLIEYYLLFWPDLNSFLIGSSRTIFFIFVAAVVSILSSVIREREQQYRVVVETQYELIWRMLPDTTCLFVNSAFCNFFSFSEPDLIGKKFCIPLSDTEKKRFCEVISSLSKRHPVEHINVTIESGTSHLHWLEWTIHGTFDDDGMILWYQLVGHDITKEKLASLTLIRSEERLNLALECARLGTFSLYSTSHMIDVDRRWAEIVGLPPQNTRGDVSEILYNRVHPDDIDTLRASIITTEEKNTENQLTFRMQHSSGSWVWVFSAWKCYRNESDTCTLGITGVLMDVTESQIMHEALLLANKKLNLLSGITRHDILNMVTAITGYYELIKEDNILTGDSKRFLENIFQATRAIQHQISFTKDYQEMGAEKPRWHRVSDMVHKVSQNSLFSTITLLDNSQNLLVYADPLFEKVIYNLLENSIRHGERVTEIQIQWHKQKTGASLVIQDNGVGVPDDMKESIFLRGVGSNTGLGLFLTKEILILTGMTIVENGERGVGARFEILIPEISFKEQK